MRAAVLTALVLLVGAIVGGAWWWKAGGGGEGLRSPVDRSAAAPSAEHSELESAPAAARSDDPSNAATPSRTPDAPPPAPADPVAPGSMVDPREGTIVVVDRDGVEHPEESGAFTFERIDPTFEQQIESAAAEDEPAPAREPDRVIVVRGRFVLDAARFRKVRLDSIELGGRLAVDGDEIQIPRKADTPIRARALWVEPVVLHVQDAATKAELAGVTVLLQSEWNLERTDHPGGDHPDDVVGRGLRSPCTLCPPLVRGHRRLAAHYWVGAPGHAWSSTRLQFDEGGEETVELEPAATLTVVVGSELLARASEQQSDPQDRFLRRAHAPAPPKAYVRLRRRPTDADDVAKEAKALRELEARDLGGIVAEVEASDAEVRFEGLAPGERLATLEVGERDAAALLVAFAAVSLQAGESSTVALTRTEPRRVALSGTLFVPPSWDAADVAIRLVPSNRRSRFAVGADRELPLAGMPSVTGRPGLHRWRFDDVTPGTYGLSIDQSWTATKWVEVGPDGRDGVELTLPDLAQVTARVVDAERGGPVEVYDLLWNSASNSGGISFRPRLHATPEDSPTTSTFNLRCPAGAVRFIVQSADWHADESQPAFELHAGEQQVEVRVRRLIGIVVTFRLDGRIVPWPAGSDGARLSVAPIGAATPRLGLSRIAGIAIEDDARFIVPAPGWYRITVPKLDGFAAVAPIDVDVDASGFVTRTVDLQRE